MSVRYPIGLGKTSTDSQRSGGSTVSSTTRELSVSIIMPVHNEDPKVPVLLSSECRAAYGNVEVIIVDDGSRPAQPLATLRHPRNQGYGAAIKSGIAVAKNKWIVTMDGDGQHNIEDIARLYDYAVNSGLDMAIGDRRLNRIEGVRRLGTQFMNILASAVTGVPISDLNCGLRVFRKDLAERYQRLLSDGFSFTTTIVMVFLAEGHKVGWVPVNIKPRMSGCSKVRLLEDGVLTVCEIVRMGGRCRIRRLVHAIRRRINNT